MEVRNYYFEIPLAQWDLYLKHIVQDIYGITDKYKVTRETEDMRVIELATNPIIPLINSLPFTIIKPGPFQYYSGNEKLVRIGAMIQNAITEHTRPHSTYYPSSQPLKLEEGELEPIIKQLARMEQITRFAPLENNSYIVSLQPHLIAAIVNISQGTLMIKLFADSWNSTFDVDDGYYGLFVCMNLIWQAWKDKHDITAPIQPPNYV